MHDDFFPQLSCAVPTVLCIDPLGMESGVISDTRITSSSDLSETSTAIYARLNQVGENNGTEGAWIAATNDKNQWVEVNLYRQMVVTGVNMQGNPSSDKWVTRYKVEFSLDHVMWEYVCDENGIFEVGLKKVVFVINQCIIIILINEKITLSVKQRSLLQICVF